jgi:hypothetical protein
MFYPHLHFQDSLKKVPVSMDFAAFAQLLVVAILGDFDRLVLLFHR